MPITPSYNSILSSAYDPDSPLTTTLMSDIVDRDDFLRQWIGDYTTAAINHAHKGAATDGTAKVAYGDISGAPPYGIQSKMIYEAVFNLIDYAEYDTGALGFTPVWMHVITTISGAAGTKCTGYAVGTAGGNQYHSLEATPFTVVPNAVAKDTGTNTMTVTQFTTAGVKIQAHSALSGTITLEIIGY